MSPALVFVMPATVSALLALVTGLGYRQHRRAYLRWWTCVWGAAALYYLTIISVALAASSNQDLFARLGLLGSVLGWVRVVGIWSGAQLLVDRPVPRRTWIFVGLVSLVWAGCIF